MSVHTPLMIDGGGELTMPLSSARNTRLADANPRKMGVEDAARMALGDFDASEDAQNNDRATSPTNVQVAILAAGYAALIVIWLSLS